MNGRARANARLMRRLLLVALAMFGFGYALVPLYQAFCALTGLNRDDAQVLARNTQVDYARRVRVELVANAPDAGTWRFRAATAAVSPHPGELVQVEYLLENLTDAPLAGRAVPSYAPAAAARWFKKIECFCFREQRLAPGERRVLPVLFVLDPALPAGLSTLTLSYTFFSQGPRT